MSLSSNLLAMAEVFDQAERPVPVDLLSLFSESLRSLAEEAAALEAQGLGGEALRPNTRNAPAPVIPLRQRLRSGPPVAMGGLLGPNSRLADVIPLPVVRIERFEGPGGAA